MNNNLTELLAPAGSYDCLRSAINAGCDAVYLGGAMFGARAFADNLDLDNMKQAIDFVHLHDKKIYLTVNTLLKNNEINDNLYNYLAPLYEHGLDAVIVQDLGVFKFIHDNFPELHIHASTQMTITGVSGARLLKQLGADRIVTARELSLNELKNIHKHVDIEIESFIHGALCYCYSGQCLLSSMLGGRSGNRGRCAQPCRLPYNVSLSDGFKNSLSEKYILSPKDMCTIKILPSIIKAGVYSLKVEGRMKSPEYVAGVIEIYRKYIDMYYDKGEDNYKVSDDDYNNLTDLYSRNGFTDGFYTNHNGRKMISLSSPAYNSVNPERIQNLNNKYVQTDKKIPIDITAEILSGKEMKLTLKSALSSISVTGKVPEPSQKRPIDSEVLTKQLSKLGNTPFCINNINISVDDNLFVPIGEINELRRNAVESLEEQLLKSTRRSLTEYNDNNINTTALEDKHRFICSIETMEQFQSAIQYACVTDIYISSDFIEFENLQALIQSAHTHNKKVFLTLPFILRDEAMNYFNKKDALIKEAGIDGLIVKNIDELEFAKSYNLSLIADYSLYSMNDISKAYLLENGISSTTVPVELNSKELQYRNNKGDEIIVYGYLPLMVTAGCIKKTLNKCSNISDSAELTDRYNKVFRVKTVCRYCYNLLYNSQPLSLLKFNKLIEKINISSIRMNFTFESAEETHEIINKFEKQFINHIETEDIENHTRGHFKRGVE